MNYVFFDIECASVNKYKAKICVFGYVLCDDKFNIIEKQDILINPKGGFHLTDRSGSKGLVLPYDYDDFKNYPPFTEFYPKIKALLEDKQNLVIGHSIINDVKYLKLETRRFNLPSFEFEFYDSQLTFMSYSDDYTKQSGLESIASSLGVEFTPHRAVDDAYATMRIVQSICEAKNCSFEQLIGVYGLSGGKIKNYNIAPPSSAGIKAYHKKMSEDKRTRAQKRITFFNYLSRKKPARGGKFYGKIFSFSRDIENDIERARTLCDQIYANGGRYSHRFCNIDYYVCNPKDETQRTASAKRLLNIVVVSEGQLKEMLNDSPTS